MGQPSGVSEPAVVSYPGARAPERRRVVMSHGLRIAVYEWGAADAPPLALVHGGFDFARTYDVFAPMLADAGWRVVAWDQRGHGDSEQSALYSWDTDMRDMVAVLATVGDAPLPVVGHSKGGALSIQLAASLPHRIGGWPTSTGSRPGGTGPTSPTTSGPSCWPASWRRGSTSGGAPPT